MIQKLLVINSLVAAVGIPVLLASWVLPFSFFVDVKSVEYHDACVGDLHQLVTADREVKWSDGYKGFANGEVFRYFEDGTKVETIIKREKGFAYQVSAEPVTYVIEWDSPFTNVGEYGASDLVTLDAPLFDKKQNFSEDNQRFNVVKCN